MKNVQLSIAAFAALTLMVFACKDTDDNGNGGGSNINSKIEFKNKSVNESLVRALPGFENLEIYTLISSDDVLSESPNFIFGAQPDGAGLLKDPNSDGYVLINNHEIHRSVSRVFLDETLTAKKGEYILNFEGGQWRTCSATMATPEEHGFGPLFLTAGESGIESMVHAIDPLGASNPADKTRVKGALGRASMENAVPLPTAAFPGKTVICIGEDDGDGQLIVYISNTVGDLENGKLYIMRRTNQDPVETSMTTGQKYDVEFVEITDAKNKTGAQLNAEYTANKALSLARIEDLDYGKGSAANNRNLYFTATGVSQADKITPVPGKTMWGRVYHLAFDEGNPLKGKLEIIIEGDSQNGFGIVNPDNICVTENYVYTQEDGDSFYKNTQHDGYIWQYNIATKTNVPMITMWHRRDELAFNAKYNTVNSALLSSWEYGAMYDISDVIGVPNTFLVNLHPHTWQEDKFLGPDGSGLSTNKEGGQVVIVRGVKK